MSHASAARSATDRNLLFGILALQMDFISRDTLIQAMNAWVLDKSKPLGQILQDQQALATDAFELLEALVKKHLALHDNDAEKSLAAVSSVGSVREQLEQIADPELHATLAYVAAAEPQPDDPHATVTYAAGAAPGPGQRYRILRPHARGGLGEVFVAMDEELHREVALKEMQERYAHQGESRSRFVREAEITGGLEHPGIVPVYGLGQYADGRPFYAMRFIRGASLKEAIEDFHKADVPGRDPGERTLALRKLLGRFLDVCNAIAYAHSRGVLHRDLKPGNIMLGQYGETLVVDWGLAKPLGHTEAPVASEEHLLQPATNGSAPTEMGRALGTPAYMSPEQAAGQHDLLGAASDVYSLGATLYCLLTGRAAVEASDAGAVMQRVQKGDFPPPRQVKPEVSAALEAVCLRAKALRPADRYASVRALAEDVEHWLADEPVSAWPEPLTLRARRWLGRHRTLVTATAAAVLVAIASLAGATVLLTAANKDLDAAAVLLTARNKDLAAAKKKTDDELLRSEWLVYGSKISLAQREWEANNVEGARDLLDACRWDFRGWEHDYLHTLFNSNQNNLRGYPSTVHCVAFSPDGKCLASGVGDRIQVWDAQTGQNTLTLTAHANGALTCVAFSPDGKRLAGGGDDKMVKVWDAQTGQNIFTLKGHTDSVDSVAFSPDGKRLVTGSLDRTMKIWDAFTGQDTLALKGPTGGVISVAFSPDGKRLVSGIADRTVKVWDATTGQDILALKGHTGWVTSVAFSPDGKRLVSSSTDGTVKVWDATTGQDIFTLKGHMGWVNSVAFSLDGKRLVSGSTDRTVKVWNAATGQLTVTLKGHTGSVNCVAMSPDGKRLASGGGDQMVKLWDAQAGQDTLALKEHTGGVSSLAFSPDGNRLASGGWDNTLRVWDAQTGKDTLTLKEAGLVWSVAFSPNGKSMVTTSGEWVTVWDTQTGHDTLTLKGHTGAVNSVAFSPDGSRIVSGSAGEVMVWDARTGQDILTLKGHTGGVKSVAFSPDGNRLASGSYDRTVKGWDAQTGLHILTFRGHTGGISSVAFSSDGKRLVSGSEDKTVKVWDVQTGENSLTLRGHTDQVWSVAFSPDGKRVVSGSFDKTVKFWDAKTGHETLTLRGHTGTVLGVAFSPDGKRLASGSQDGTVKIWDARTSAPRNPNANSPQAP